MSSFKKDFLLFAHRKQALKFGEFTTKAGRQSPYFFNAGFFNDGESLKVLAHYYALAILDSNLDFDMIFGPAYKGIPLSVATAIALSEKGKNTPFAFNRKEIKDHGEGGNLVGAPLQGKVLIIDDVISAGTSVRESIQIISEHGAQPVGVVVALDRMEKGAQGNLSAIEEVEKTFDIPVIAIATLNDLINLVKENASFETFLPEITQYRAQYGV